MTETTLPFRPRPPKYAGRKKTLRDYCSLIFLFIPALLFGLLLLLYKENDKLRLSSHFPYAGWQFYAIGLFGMIGTAGGILDWRYHRNPLNLKIPKKERDAEAFALGAGGVPMFLLMWFAMLSSHPGDFLIPIIIVLIYNG